jgi:hypothetical protein
MRSTFEMDTEVGNSLYQGKQNEQHYYKHRNLTPEILNVNVTVKNKLFKQIKVEFSFLFLTRETLKEHRQATLFRF